MRTKCIIMESHILDYKIWWNFVKLNTSFNTINVFLYVSNVYFFIDIVIERNRTKNVVCDISRCVRYKINKFPNKLHTCLIWLNFQDGDNAAHSWLMIYETFCWKQWFVNEIRSLFSRHNLTSMEHPVAAYHQPPLLKSLFKHQTIFGTDFSFSATVPFLSPSSSMFLQLF